MSGLNAWLVQRLSAVYSLLFIVYLSLHFLLEPPGSYEQWQQWMRQPLVSTASLIFFGALSLHMWVGLRDVVLDYVHSPGLRVCLLASVAIGLAAMAAWTARILLG
ncbi:MAG: succinate dehydrogenase, hydrophobic membrane anchor protein [Burkholderiales bacterium]|nr:succinate dehydrogenase, hydrophobic membrane anchor protein [Burkholderiales bacterium]